MEWIVVKTLLSLAAVIGLMIAVVYVMKKFLFGGHVSSSSVVEMSVIGTMTLHPKRSIAVIKVMNKVLIVGVSEEGMQTLGELTDPAMLSLIDAKLEAAAATPRWSMRKSSGEKVGFAEALAVQVAKLTSKGQA